MPWRKWGCYPYGMSHVQQLALRTVKATPRFDCTYLFDRTGSAYAQGLREYRFESDMPVGVLNQRQPIAILEMDVLAMGAKFRDFRAALKQAYAHVPMSSKKHFWSETIQHPDGMRDRIYMRLDNPFRLAGLLREVNTGSAAWLEERDVNRMVAQYGHAWSRYCQERAATR